MPVDEWEGRTEIESAWRDGMAPDPALTVSEWADRHRILSTKAAAEAGPYRTGRTPYMAQIMDDLSPSSDIRGVYLMKGAQVGATEVANNWVGYVVAHAPASMMVVQPTVELAKRLSQYRIDPMIKASPELAKRILPARSRDSSNTIYSKGFPGGQLTLTGANSAVGLRAQPVRYLVLDEVDSYPIDVDDEGDPVTLALARTRSYGYRAKFFMPSTPTIKGISRIEREYLASDRRHYFVPCPLCGHLQHLQFKNLRWRKHRPETVQYRCSGCGKQFDEHHKTWMMDPANGAEWIPTAKKADIERAQVARIRGYHLNSLYSPLGWCSWQEIARDWLAAQDNDAMLRAFVNTVLGEAWQDRGDAPDWERIYERAGGWPIGKIPDGAVVLTGGADVQRDRIEVSVWGWGAGIRSYLVDHVVLTGTTARRDVWKKLDRLLTREWPSVDGSRRLRMSRLAVDSGDQAEMVYRWVRRVGTPDVVAVKGMAGFRRMSPVDGPSLIERTERGRRTRAGVHLWTVSVDVFKRELYQWLRLTIAPDEDQDAEYGSEGPPGYVHLPDGVPAEWCRQLVAERLVRTTDKRGYPKLEWQQTRPRNEALDCRVYARAVAWLMGIDRWTEQDWQSLAGTTLDERKKTAKKAPARARPRQNWLGDSSRRRNWIRGR